MGTFISGDRRLKFHFRTVKHKKVRLYVKVDATSCPMKMSESETVQWFQLFSVSWKPNVFLLFVRFSVRWLDVTNVSTGAATLDVSDRSGRGNLTCRKHASDNCELSSLSLKCSLFIYVFMTLDCWACWWTRSLKAASELLSSVLRKHYRDQKEAFSQVKTREMEEVLGYFTRVEVVILHCKNTQTESPALQISCQ